MSIDLSSYYNYLNTISSDLTQTINSANKSNYNLTKSEESSSDFESAFLSMINQSKDAYSKIAQENDSNTLAVDATESGSELYDNLTQILNSYNSMSSSSKVPNSIKESLFNMLNEDSNPSVDKNSDYQSDLSIDSLIQTVSKQL